MSNKFLGSSVRYFDGNIGWGNQLSTLRVGLVEDFSAGDNFAPVSHGAPIRFEYSGWIFDGIYASVEEKRGADGGGNRTLEVTVTSPTQILEGVNLIIGGYTGSIFNVPNLYNIYGELESTGFGDSGVNDAGLSWTSISNTIQSMVLTNPIDFNGFTYSLDLTGLPALDSSFRIPGNNISLLSFITEVCEAASYDFFIELVGTVITVSTIPRDVPATLTKITEFVNALTIGSVNNTTSFDLEYNTTSKFVVGGNKEDVFFQFATELDEDEEDNTIWPFWGFDDNGNVVIGHGLDNDHEFTVDGRYISYPNIPGFAAGYKTNVSELRAALVSQESWESFLIINNAAGIHQGKATQLKLKGNVRGDIKTFLDGLDLNQMKTLTPTDLSNFADTEKIDPIDVEQAYITRVYEFVKTFATEFFGRKFMVRVPQVFVKKEPDTQKIVTNFEVSDSGYIEEAQFPNAVANNLMPLDTNFVTNSDSKIEAYVKFDGWLTDELDLSSLADTDYTVTNDSVFVKCSVEPLFVYLDSINFTDPRVVITLPGPVYSGNLPFNPVGVLRQFIFDAAVGVLHPDPDQFADDFFKQPGADTMFFGEAALPLIPDMAAIPLRSNTDTYGPWYSIGIAGRTEFQQNEELVPWNFGGFTAMNAAGTASTQDALSNRIVIESGSVQVPGSPTVRLGNELIAGGPYLTDINVDVNNGITTNYRMSTWSVKPGKRLRYNLDRFKLLSRVQQDQRRSRRSIFQQGKPLIPKSPAFFRGEDIPGRLSSNKSNSSNMVMGNANKDDTSEKVKPNISFSPSFNTITNRDSSGVYPNLAGGSLDTIIRPFVTASGTDNNLPFMESPTAAGSGSVNINELNPFSEGNDFSVTVRGDTHPETLNNDIREGGPDDIYRGIALRGPLVITGYGRDKNNKPVPNANPSSPTTEYLTNYKQRSDKWPVGPADLRWDQDTKTWIAPRQIFSARAIDTIHPIESGRAYLEGDFENTIYIRDKYNHNLVFPDETVPVTLEDGEYVIVGEHGLTRKGYISAAILPPGSGEVTVVYNDTASTTLTRKFNVFHDWLYEDGVAIGTNNQETQVIVQYFPKTTASLSVANGVDQAGKWTIIQAGCSTAPLGQEPY